MAAYLHMNGYTDMEYRPIEGEAYRKQFVFPQLSLAEGEAKFQEYLDSPIKLFVSSWNWVYNGARGSNPGPPVLHSN